MDGTTNAATAPGRDECVRILASLPALPLEARGEQVERLVRNSSPDIRDRALHIGAAVLSDDRLCEMLRADGDAVLRNAGSEMFRLRGGRSLAAVVALLGDADPDVVLQAVLILDRMRDPRALEPLYRLLSHSDANVVQEVVLAIGRLGDGRSVPRLLPYLNSEPWIRLAVLQALGDLRSAEGTGVLVPLLHDFLEGELAAESLARIGGEAAFEALATCWLEGGLDEGEAMAGLLAHVLEGLPAPPGNLPAGLEERLGNALRAGPSASAALRTAAARCLLCLGPGAWDAEALAVLAAAEPSSGFIPDALGGRSDLLGPLLRGSYVERSWGFLLAARFPDRVPEEDLIAAVRAVARGHEAVTPALVEALARAGSPAVTEELLDLYLRAAPDSWSMLAPALAARGAEVREAVEERRDLGAVVRLELLALAGAPDAELSPPLLALAPRERAEAVSALFHRESLLRGLPWSQWLAEAPDLFTGLAAEAAGRLGLVELKDALRGRLAEAPSEALVRAAGKLRDTAGTPILLRLLSERPALRSVAMEALGRLGGDAAREALRQIAGVDGPDSRLAYRALAACHAEEDLPVFRGAAAHPDWFVRLAAVEVLAASVDAEDAALLARLVADPVPAVAERALALLPVRREESH